MRLFNESTSNMSLCCLFLLAPKASCPLCVGKSTQYFSAPPIELIYCALGTTTVLSPSEVKRGLSSNVKVQFNDEEFSQIG